MNVKRNTHLILIASLTLAVLLGGVGLSLASATPVAAQEPGAGEAGLVVIILPNEGDVAAAEVGPPPVFNVGDVFTVAIVAQGISDPGLFGAQFEVSYQTEYLNAVDGTLSPGSDMLPVVNPVNNVDNGSGLVEFAASRQGDLDNLLGDIVLATFDFEAVGATEPPEGQTTVIHLQNVKLGAKGGVEVPVSGTVDLEVIIREGVTPVDGEIVGNVKVEGRAPDNQAGHEVTATGSISGTLMTTTDMVGDFLFDNVPADTYAMEADSAGFLAASCADVVHPEDAITTLADLILLAGDINDDDVIDIVDATAIGAVFGSTGPEIADLNVDGVVDILDLILMAANYGQTSVGNPWLCAPSSAL